MVIIVVSLKKVILRREKGKVLFLFVDIVNIILLTKKLHKEHEINCRPTFKGGSEIERMITYSEVLTKEKEFTNYHSFNRVPFVTGDFETRLVKGRRKKSDGTCEDIYINKHVPYSYALFYVNPFNTKDSLFYSFKSLKSEEVLKRFLIDCDKLAKYHNDLQNVEIALDKTPYAGGKYFDSKGELVHNDCDEMGICPWCTKDMVSPEFNHTHFEKDNLNKHLNIHICKSCNMRNQVRNKGLSVFFHNGSKFDFKLFAPALFNSNLFKKANDYG